MKFKSIPDLNESVRRWAWDLPTSIDLVVGIPRSGLLAANLLCLHLDVPMTDVEGLCREQITETGHRYDDDVSTLSDVNHALVVDDSVYSGRQMTETRERLEAFDFPFEVEYGAAYISSEGHQYVDHWQEVVPTPRAFEWNLMHQSVLRSTCVDIDGVLCRDPTKEENDDGESYREFLTNVEPRIVPSKPVGWLVTCRLEKYRDLTEAWLDEHGIEYDELVMMNLPSKEARRASGTHAEYKAEQYDQTDADLFIESSRRQAAEIAERTGKPVYCYESNQMVQPGTLDRMQNRGGEYLSRFVEDPVAFSLLASRFLFKRGRNRTKRSFGN